MPQAFIQSIRAARQAKLAAGSISVSVLRDADRALWIRTVCSADTALADPSLRRVGRIVTGMHIGNAVQRAADILRHSYVPGLMIGNLPIASESGTGRPGSPINPAGPPSMHAPGGQPW
jgi:hypothetical protein